MPPTRTIPPAKATERTHEENQERAYIAASRRSDRSLEARVESARRASEIHKRRTGRSLRVTEQDVVNEEMYEEEDDDLPLAYRRLTAHLQTNSAEFNQRLNAYITNQVAMRSALERSIAINNMNGGSDFLNSTTSMFPSPMLAHQQQKMVQHPSGGPASYRQAPYPSPRPPPLNFSDPQHRRSNSIAVPQQAFGNAQNTPAIADDQRRMSLPVKAKEAPASQDKTTSDQSNVRSCSIEQRPSFNLGSFTNVNHPFTLALPAESQMLLGSSFSASNDPLIGNMMAGSSNLPQAEHYNYTSNSNTELNNDKQDLPAEYQGGLNATLAPSTLNDNNNNNTSSNNNNSNPTTWDLSGQEDAFFNEAIEGDNFSSGLPPDVNGESWGNFIDTDQWDTLDGGLET